MVPYLRIALSVLVMGMAVGPAAPIRPALAQAAADAPTVDTAVPPTEPLSRPSPHSSSADVEPLGTEPAQVEPIDAERIEAQLPTCPPGQFPSAFRDVLPSHWAYQAVLNLAAPPIRCFDYP